MCGIAGIWKFEGRVAQASLDRFTDSLSHRGPDGRGTEILDGGRLGLGHRRLSILDLSENGRQPMSCCVGRYWISYNGEIFNFVELREELEGLGYSFRTRTDTEIILAAYDRWREDAWRRFNGMWALAIWDGHERRLALSRDRFGIKPLFYAKVKDGFVFASELKAFRRLDGFRVGMDPGVVARSIRDVFSVESGEATLIAGVRRLKAGRSLGVAEGGEFQFSRWWRTTDHCEDTLGGYGEQTSRFGELFADAIRLRMRSDAPLGTSLSGGLDSTSVLCAAAGIREKGERQASLSRAFVASFPGSVNDETDTAIRTAESLGVPCTVVESGVDASPEALLRSVHDLEEIYLTPPLPAWRVYAAQRDQGVAVSMDGHGADELLAGYPHHGEWALREGAGLALSPRRAWELAGIVRRQSTLDGGECPVRWSVLARHDPFVRRGRSLALGLYRATLKPLWLAVKRARGRLSSSSTEPWLPAEGVASGVVSEDADAISKWSPLNKALYRDFHETILPTILRNFDRSSMAHGVEIRMPFMDWRLVRFAFSLPERAKLGGGKSKRILRDAMSGGVPEAVRLAGGKVGFNSPLCDWLAGPLKEWLSDELASRAFQENELWNSREIRQLAEKRRNEGGWTWSEAERLWPILNAHLLASYHRTETHS